MIIIKPSLENKPTNDIAENSARAPYFLVYEDETFIKAIKNPFTAWGGAGPAVVDLLENENCKHFIAKKIWDKMLAALETAGISYDIVK